jgi:hypothetical protein
MMSLALASIHISQSLLMELKVLEISTASTNNLTETDSTESQELISSLSRLAQMVYWCYQAALEAQLAPDFDLDSMLKQDN